jgi:hypothetical protein
MLCAKQVKVHGNEHPQLKETADASTHKNLEYCYQFNLLELQIIYILVLKWCIVSRTKILSSLPLFTDRIEVLSGLHVNCQGPKLTTANLLTRNA